MRRGSSSPWRLIATRRPRLSSRPAAMVAADCPRRRFQSRLRSAPPMAFRHHCVRREPRPAAGAATSSSCCVDRRSGDSDAQAARVRALVEWRPRALQRCAIILRGATQPPLRDIANAQSIWRYQLDPARRRTRKRCPRRGRSFGLSRRTRSGLRAIKTCINGFRARRAEGVRGGLRAYTGGLFRAVVRLPANAPNSGISCRYLSLPRTDD